MPVLNRTLFGALIGALIVLVFHVHTRPYFAPWIVAGQSGLLARTPLLAENIGRVPEPDSPEIAGYWMLLAADRLQSDRVVSADDVSNWVTVARAWSLRDRQNAFWHQMLALLLSVQGDGRGSAASWERASKQPRWNDYQTERLTTVIRKLSTGSETMPSWQRLWIYRRRSATTAQVMFRLASQQLARVQPRSLEGLKARALLLRNGVLLRDGSRSVAAFRIGMATVELASRNRQVSNSDSQRKLLLQRFEFINDLRAAGLEADAEFAVNEFRKNSSWEAVVDPDEQAMVGQRAISMALLAVVLPSGFLSAALAFALVYFCGCVLSRFPQLCYIFRPSIAPLAGLVAGVAVYAVSRWIWAALLIVVGMALFGFTPSAKRDENPVDLGPLFRFIVAIFGLCILCGWIGFWATCSTGGVQMLEDLSVSPDFVHSRAALAGILALLVFLAMLLAPAWSLVQRYPSPKIVPVVFRELGGRMTVVSLILAVLMGPLAVWLDQENQIVASALAENEPIYFYNRWNQ